MFDGQTELTKETEKEHQDGLVKNQDSAWVRESPRSRKNHRGWPPFSDNLLPSPGNRTRVHNIKRGELNAPRVAILSSLQHQLNLFKINSPRHSSPSMGSP